MAQAAVRVAAGDAALSAAVREEQDLASHAKELETDLLASLAGNDASRAGALRSELAATRGRLEASARTLDAEFPNYRVLTAATAIPLSETQALLGRRQGILFLYSYGPDNIYVMAASRDRFAWAKVATPSARVREQMALLRCHVDPSTCTDEQRRRMTEAPATPSERKGFARYDLEVAHQLYVELVKPVEEALQGCDGLFVTTTSNLANLPLALLATRPPKTGADLADPEVLRRAEWLGDRYAITILPSIAALRLTATGGPSPAAKRSFEGFGDPRLGAPEQVDRGIRMAVAGQRPKARDAELAVFRAQGPAGELLADPRRLASLASLPGTRVELTAMAQIFPRANTNVTTGEAFTEAAFRSRRRLRDARIVAIATHGILPSRPASIDQPGLVMTPPKAPTRDDDGVLTATEAASLSLTADWVILSACNTASVEGQEDEDSLSSLARGFLYAGAKALLASHWRVWDTSTAALTVETLRERESSKGLSRATALQHAMHAVRTGRRADGLRVKNWKPEWAHPSAWAAFSNIAYAD
jgi:CHAT domain-containing protein